jgi:hypothetical protein
LLVKHALLVSAVLGWVVGCHSDKQAAGPMERAGKHVDHAAEKTGKALEKAASKTGDAAEKAAHATGEAFEKAGKKLKGDDKPAPGSSAKPAK